MDLSKILPATLNSRQTERYAEAKSEMDTRLDVKSAKDKDDEKQLDAWRKGLRLRAKGRCQHCGIKTVKTLALDPKRGEGHHLVGRADKALRYDLRNGLHLCLKCHTAITTGKLFVQQLAKHLFKLGDRTLVNGAKPVTFTEKAA